MAKQTITRRQKDISRLLREKRQAYADKLKSQKQPKKVTYEVTARSHLLKGTKPATSSPGSHLGELQQAIIKGVTIRAGK